MVLTEDTLLQTLQGVCIFQLQLFLLLFETKQDTLKNVFLSPQKKHFLNCFRGQSLTDLFREKQIKKVL